jgi:hypothetical protein
VLIDNIGICTPRKDVALYWFDRIVETARKYGYHLKIQSVKSSASDEEKRSALLKECFVEMSPKHPERCFNFAGVDWYHNRHCVPVDEEEQRQAIAPGATQEDGEWSWTGTRRELASLLGKIMWTRRVAGQRLTDGDGCATALSAIYAGASPRAGAEWSEIIRVGGGAVRHLQDA